MKLEDLLKLNLSSSDCAVIENNVSYSYSQLGVAVRTLEECYVKYSVQRVMLCLPQSCLAYAAMLAAYLTKTTYCPIDVDAPIVRKAYFIEKYKPDLILTIQEVELPSHVNALIKDIEDLCLSGSCHADPAQSLKKIEVCEVQQNKIAYVIFTSGSTGYPKGVAVSRRVLENFVQFGLKEYKITNKDIWGQFSKLSFDLSIFDVFVAVAGGATLVPIASRGLKLLPARMIDKYKITYWHSVPSVIDLINFDRLKENSLQSLRIMNFAGEALFPHIVRKLFSVNKNMRIYNVFGHTETTFALYQKLEAHNYEQFLDSTVSIGKPIPNYKVYLREVKDGIGEIVISGFIADGYLEENDSNSFQTLKMDGKAEYSFLSGDYGYYSGDNLYFWGRTDTQIKHKGNRIDLNEIDNAFRICGYNSATVYYQNKIVSFVIRTNDNEKMIKEHLRMQLPDYYIPQSIIILQSMPYNASNKIDKKLLIGILENGCNKEVNVNR